MKTKQILTIIAMSILGIIVLFILCFGLSWAGIAWSGFFGPKQATVQQEVWQNSSPHVQSVEQDLAKEQLELAKTTDPQARQAIISYLQTECAGVDPNTINNPQLRIFMEQIQSGQIN